MIYQQTEPIYDIANRHTSVKESEWYRQKHIAAQQTDIQCIQIKGSYNITDSFYDYLHVGKGIVIDRNHSRHNRPTYLGRKLEQYKQTADQCPALPVVGLHRADHVGVLRTFGELAFCGGPWYESRVPRALSDTGTQVDMKFNSNRTQIAKLFCRN